MTTGIPNSCAERARASRFRRVCSGSWIRLNKPSCWSTSSSTAFCGVTGSRRVGLVALGMAWSAPSGTSQRPLVVAFLVDAPLWEGTPHPASGKKDIVGLYPANMGLHHVVTLTLDGCVLLDGRRATTHWALAAQLADRFPQVMVDAGVLYV